MKTITLNIPEGVDLDKKEAALLLATKLFEQGRLTLGQAAEVAGYSKRTFMELLGNYSVSLFNYDEQDLENDVRNADDHHI